MCRRYPQEQLCAVYCERMRQLLLRQLLLHDYHPQRDRRLGYCSLRNGYGGGAHSLRGDQRVEGDHACVGESQSLTVPQGKIPLHERNRVRVRTEQSPKKRCLQELFSFYFYRRNIEHSEQRNNSFSINRVA